MLFYIFTAFTGIITAVAAWSIWGGDWFPPDRDPSGGMLFYKLYTFSKVDDVFMHGDVR